MEVKTLRKLLPIITLVTVVCLALACSPTPVVVDAEALLEDACAGAAPIISYDVVMDGKSERIGGPTTYWTSTGQIQGLDYHEKIVRSNGGGKGEVIVLYDEGAFSRQTHARGNWGPCHVPYWTAKEFEANREA